MGLQIIQEFEEPTKEQLLRELKEAVLEPAGRKDAGGPQERPVGNVAVVRIEGRQSVRAIENLEEG